MYVLGVSFQETFSNAQVIGHQFELGNFGTRRELSGNFIRVSNEKKTLTQQCFFQVVGSWSGCDD